MLTPEYLGTVTDEIEKISEDCHNYILTAIIRRIVKRLEDGMPYLITAVDRNQLALLTEMGFLMEDLQKGIAIATDKQFSEIQEAVEDAAVRSVEYDDAFYKSVGLEPPEIKRSPYILRLAERNSEVLKEGWQSYTKSAAESAQDRYFEAIDKAYNLVSTGAISKDQAIKEAVEDIAENGVEILYPSGHKDTIEVATTRAVRTGIAQMSGDITLKRMDEMNWDIVLASSHFGARVTKQNDYTNHYWWQGKFYSRSGNDKRFPPFSVCGFGKIQGICGANCRHSISPGDGKNNPFAKFDEEKNRKLYETEQRQRSMERGIRKTKRVLLGIKAGIDASNDKAVKERLTADYQKKAALLKQQNKEYREFCEENGLTVRNDRISIANWNRSQAASASSAARMYEMGSKQ